MALRSVRNDEDLVQLANDMLSQLHVTTRVDRLADITPAIFVTLFEGLAAQSLPDIVKGARTSEAATHNAQAVIDALSLDVLNISLSHITGEDIARGDRTAVANLLEVFSGLLEYILDRIWSEASSVEGDPDHREELDDPDLVTPELIDNILQRELGRQTRPGDRSVDGDRLERRASNFSRGSGGLADDEGQTDLTCQSPPRMGLRSATWSGNDDLPGLNQGSLRDSRQHARAAGKSGSAGDSTIDLICESERRRRQCAALDPTPSFSMSNLGMSGYVADPGVPLGTSGSVADPGVCLGTSESVEDTGVCLGTSKSVADPGVCRDSGIRTTHSSPPKTSAALREPAVLDSSVTSSVAFPQSVNAAGVSDHVTLSRDLETLGQRPRVPACAARPPEGYAEPYSKSATQNVFTHHLYHHYEPGSRTAPVSGAARDTEAPGPLRSTAPDVVNLPTPSSGSMVRGSQSFERLDSMVRDTVALSRAAVRTSPIRNGVSGPALSGSSPSDPGADSFQDMPQKIRSALENVDHEARSVARIARHLSGDIPTLTAGHQRPPDRDLAGSSLATHGDMEPVRTARLSGDREPGRIARPSDDREPVRIARPSGDREQVRIARQSGDREQGRITRPSGNREPVRIVRLSGDREPVRGDVRGSWPSGTGEPGKPGRLSEGREPDRAGLLSAENEPVSRNNRSLAGSSRLAKTASDTQKGILSPGRRRGERQRKNVSFRPSRSAASDERLTDTISRSSAEAAVTDRLSRFCSVRTADPANLRPTPDPDSATAAMTSHKMPNVNVTKAERSGPDQERLSHPETFREYLRKYYGREDWSSEEEAGEGDASYMSDGMVDYGEAAGHVAYISGMDAELTSCRQQVEKRANKNVRFEEILDDSSAGRMADIRRKLGAEGRNQRVKTEYLSEVYKEELADFENEMADSLKKTKTKASELEREYKTKVVKQPQTNKYKPSKRSTAPVSSVLLSPPPRHRSRSKRRAGLVRGRKRSYSASPTMGRASPSRIHENEILPWLLEEFPYIHLSSEALHDMWRKSARQIEHLSKAEKEIKRRKSKSQIQVKEAEQKQKIVLDMFRKELSHQNRLREAKERQRAQQSVKACVREKRQQSARARKYYDEYQVLMRSKMLRKRTQEELIFKKLFRESLDIQKERIRDLRRYAREQRSVRAEKQQNELESLENYYKDQFSMVAEAMAREKEETEIKEKAQSKVLDQMKKELRRKMEREIRDFQEQLYRDEDEAYFRELDAERLRHQLHLTRYQARV